MLKILSILLPVKIQSTIVSCPPTPQDVPGIGTAAVYAAGDAFGDKFIIQVPQAGVIQTAIFLDKDDEGIETELVLFNKDFTATADNAVFDVSDANLQGFIGTITFATFKNFNSNQVSTASAIGLWYRAPGGLLYAQMVTRGAPNIAVGNIPMVQLTISQEES